MSEIIVGPHNYLKIEGNINNVNKIIYIYYDNFKDNIVNNNNNKVSIDNYLFNKFKNSNKLIDFFFEINEDIINESEYYGLLYKKNNNINKYDHIKELQLIFKNEFKKTNEGKIIQSNKYKNIRLHWSDMRHHNLLSYIIQVNINTLIKSLNNQIKYFYENKILLDIKVFENLINSIKNINNNIKIFYDYLIGKRQEDNINIKYIYKIKEKYNNKKIKNKVKKLIDIIENNTLYIIKKSDKIINSINNYIKNYNNIELKMNLIINYDSPLLYLINIFRYIKKIEKSILTINNIFIEIYTLRRILDKDYINNVIIYSNSEYIMKHIFSLVNIFDFIITESYNNINLNKLNNKIKNLQLNNNYNYDIQLLLNNNNINNNKNEIKMIKPLLF